MDLLAASTADLECIARPLQDRTIGISESGQSALSSPFCCCNAGCREHPALSCVDASPCFCRTASPSWTAPASMFRAPSTIAIPRLLRTCQRCFSFYCTGSCNTQRRNTAMQQLAITLAYMTAARMSCHAIVACACTMFADRDEGM